MNANDNEGGRGHINPVVIVLNDIVKAFSRMGFEVVTGPEIDSEYYNFDALNVPADHPARDMQDTFWLSGESKKNLEKFGSIGKHAGDLIRTHTSTNQIHYMEKHSAPLKIVSPGKVYRYEATDKTHEVQFHQVEGLLVGKDVNVGHLKFALNHFLKQIFGGDVEIRLRPSFFPFVEPGFEVDMRRSGGKWIEILGAGMVHPNVLNNVGINPLEWTGFAFGVGVDRIAMLKYGIDDVRMFYNGDLRLINQF